MRRRLPAVLFVSLLLVLGGCAQLAMPAPRIAVEGQSYVCRLGDNVNTPGPEQRLTVQSDPQNRQLVVRFGQGDWQALGPVAKSSGRVYANASYAWRGDGTGGVLTDIRRIETYNCTGDAVPLRQAR